VNLGRERAPEIFFRELTEGKTETGGTVAGKQWQGLAPKTGDQSSVIHARVG